MAYVSDKGPQRLGGIRGCLIIALAEAEAARFHRDPALAVARVRAQAEVQIQPNVSRCESKLLASDLLDLPSQR
jgi:hypothetical protein